MRPDERNPLRNILMQALEEVDFAGYARRGTPVQYPAWVPVKHPFSGERVSILITQFDRLILDKEAAELQKQFDMPTVNGTADDYYDGSDEAQ